MSDKIRAILIGKVLPAICLLAMVSAVKAQTLQAYVDRTSIAANETVNFTLSIDRQVDINGVDFSALYDDFRVFGISPRSQTQIIDGKMSATTTWLVTLMPKQTGKLTIPPVDVAGTSSKVIVLDVSEAPQSISMGADIEVQVEVDRREAYINEQILVTVRLVAPNQSSDLSGEALLLTDAEATLLEQQQFRRVSEGVAYQVVEWRYAVFSGTAGTLTIPAQVFSVVINTTARQRFDPFTNQARRVIGSSEEIGINVLPIPGDAVADWFPARDVKLSASWQNDSDTYRVGEPLTRNIVVSSIGQKPAAIPPLDVSNSSDFKVYADQPQLTEDTSSLGILGTRTESMAMVPSVAGVLEIPAITVNWWDIDQRRWKESVLPAETIIVEPPDSTVTPAPPTEIVEEPLVAGEIANRVIALVPGWLPGVTLALGLGLLLMVLQNVRLRRQLGKSTISGTEDETSLSEKQAWRHLGKTLKTGDARSARNAILAWGREFWHKSSNVTLEYIGVLGESPELQELLAELDRNIYRQEDSSKVDFQRLGVLFTGLRRSGRVAPDTGSALPGLYLANS